MNASKKIAIGFLVFVFGMIFFSLIFVGCDKVTSSNKNNGEDNSEESSSFNQSLLKTDSTKEFTDIIVPVNKKWKLENRLDKDDDLYDSYYHYDIDDGNSYLSFWITTQESYSTLESLKDYFDNDSDYEDKHSKIFELFNNINALETTYTDSTLDDYTHEIKFFAYNECYELRFTGDKKLKDDIETLFNNVVCEKMKIYTYENTTEEPTTEDYDSDDDYDYNYDDYDDYEEETTTKSKKDTLVYSDSNVNIYFYDVTEDYGDTEVNFKVKNKTSKKLEFQADTVTLDGVSYNDISMSDPVAPKSTGIISITSDSIECNQPKTVGGEFKYFDGFVGKTIDKNVSFVNVKVK